MQKSVIYRYSLRLRIITLADSSGLLLLRQLWAMKDLRLKAVLMPLGAMPSTYHVARQQMHRGATIFSVEDRLPLATFRLRTLQMVADLSLSVLDGTLPMAA